MENSKQHIKLRVGANWLIILQVGLFSLLSYPLAQLGDWYLYGYIVGFIDAPEPDVYARKAYVVTVSIFLVFILFFFIFRIGRAEEHYSLRSVQHGKGRHAALVGWLVSTVLLVIVIGSFFVSTGFTLPLLQSMNLPYWEYNVLRAAVHEQVSQSLFQVSVTILSPINMLYACICLRQRLFILISVALLLCLCLFTLAKSSLGVAFLVMAYAFILARPIRLGKIAFYIASIVLLVVVLGINSLRGEKIGEALVDRVVHGQWVGLPLYLWYFEDNHSSVWSITHPVVRNLAGVDPHTTPSRELMIATHPLAVEEGGAGTIPTFFVGEAYAVFGDVAFIWAPLVVCLEWFLINWFFSRLPKNPVTMVLYAWSLYKIGSGILLGVSGFIFSAFPVFILMLLAYIFILDTQKAQRRLEQAT